MEKPQYSIEEAAAFAVINEADSLTKAERDADCFRTAAIRARDNSYYPDEYGFTMEEWRAEFKRSRGI